MTHARLQTTKNIAKNTGLPPRADRLAAARARVIALAGNHEVMHSGGHLPKCGLCTAVRDLRAVLADTETP